MLKEGSEAVKVSNIEVESGCGESRVLLSKRSRLRGKFTALRPVAS